MRGRWVRLVVVVIVAAVVYGLFVKSATVDRGRMASLALRTTGIAGFQEKPTAAKALDLSKITDPTLKKAAQDDPGATGVYEITWKSAAQDEVGVLVELVPSSQQAVKVQAAGRKQLMSQSAQPQQFAVPNIPGSVGKQFAAPGGSAAQDIGVVFRVDRAVVLVLAQLSSPTLQQSDVSALSLSEYRLLQRKEPSFALTLTKRPLGWSVLFAVGALLAAAGLWFVPEWVMAMRARRHEAKALRAEERARSQYRSRGRRVVKRHRAPDWVMGKWH